MVNPLQMKDNVGERREPKRETQGLGGTHGQMEVCLDENGFLRSGQFKCLYLYVYISARERLKVWGEHMTRLRCVWTRMGFCTADNLNAYISAYILVLERDSRSGGNT